MALSRDRSSSLLALIAAVICLPLGVLCLDYNAGSPLRDSRCTLFDEVPTCFHRMGYNLTRWPNSLDESSASAANMRLKNMELLVRTQCHPWLFAFLCFAHVPHCEDTYVESPKRHITRVVGPCRQLCETVRDSCTKYIEFFNRSLSWPSDIYNCSNFISSPGQCFLPTGHENETTIPTGYDLGSKIEIPEEILHPRTTKTTTVSTTTIICDGGAAIGSKWYQFGGQTYCGQSCHEDTMFTESQRERVIPTLIFLFSSLSAVCLLLSLVSYLADQKNFIPAEWSVLVITGCALVSAIVQLSAISTKLTGQSQACDRSSGAVYQGLGGQNRLPPVGCLLYFLLTYFCNTLALFTWLKLSVFWLVSVMATKSTVVKFESCCNLPATAVVWFLPAGLTVSAFFLQKIDGGILTGSCFVGHYDTRALLSFLVCPLSAVSVAVLFCLFVGWRVLLLHRKYSLLASPQSNTTTSSVATTNTTSTSGGAVTTMSSPPRNTVARNILRVNPAETLYGDRFERLGKFCFLLLIPSVLTTGTLLYEYMEHESWQYTTVACSRDSESPGCLHGSRPIVSIFGLRFASPLLTALICLWYKNLLRRWIPCLKRACSSTERCMQGQCVSLPAASTSTSPHTVANNHSTPASSTVRGSASASLPSQTLKYHHQNNTNQSLTGTAHAKDLQGSYSLSRDTLDMRHEMYSPASTDV